MNKNILIVLAGGFLVAVFVAMMVQASLTSSKKEQPTSERVEILVAAKSLKTGAELKSGDIRWQIWPDDSVFPGAIIRDGEQAPTEAIEGKLLRSLVEGQPLHITLVTEEDKGDFLSANIKKGMRAVGVAVKSHVLADRLIRPGDFVDVMVTYRVRVNSRDNPKAQSLVNRYATETIIENVRVLAVDGEDTKAIDEEEDKKAKKKKSSSKAVLTLEVTSEAAEKLVLAGKMGDIGLALRSIGDLQDPDGDKTTTDVGMSRVMTDLSNMSETSSGVRIYNGLQIQEVQARSPKTKSSVDFDVQDSVEDQPANIIIDPQTLQGLTDEE